MRRKAWGDVRGLVVSREAGVVGRRTCGVGLLRRGFTLLEVLLALALSMIVVIAIGYAIFFHLRVIDSQRNRVEQGLLARGMLNLMASDLRAAVQYKAVDVSELETLLASVDLAALLSSPGAAELVGSAGGVSMEDLLLEEGEETETVTEGEEGPRPGLYGTSTELMIDISRMPRRDQYLYGFQTTADDYASDLRTISYRLVPTQSLPSELTQGANQAVNAGSLADPSQSTSMTLVRNSASQAAIRYAQLTGQLTEYFGQTEILANEVVGLQFQYYDGSNQSWVSEWDTDEMQSLPTAVEIVVQVEFRGDNFRAAGASGSGAVTETFRQVVHLPLAEPSEESGSDDSSSSESSTGDADAAMEETP